MIGRPTVLVLGAGASHTLGFPLGPDLKMQLQGRDKALTALVEEIGWSADALANFQTALSYEGSLTIDEFLMRRPEWADVARMAIAYHIGKHEQDESLRATNPPHWFHKLFRKMRERASSPKEFQELNSLSVVTFNYDRSFERSLWLALRSTFSADKHSDREIAQAHGAIRTIHVHGDLGELPEVAMLRGNPSFTRERRYAPPTTLPEFRIATGGIKVISEIKDGGSDFDEAHKKLWEAEHVIFLGFGFDRTNLEHLAIERLAKAAQVTACYYKMGKEQLQTAGAHFEKCLGASRVVTSKEAAPEFVDFILRRLG